MQPTANGKASKWGYVYSVCDAYMRSFEFYFISLFRFDCAKSMKHSIRQLSINRVEIKKDCNEVKRRREREREIKMNAIIPMTHRLAFMPSAIWYQPSSSSALHAGCREHLVTSSTNSPLFFLCSFVVWGMAPTNERTNEWPNKQPKKVPGQLEHGGLIYYYILYTSLCVTRSTMTTKCVSHTYVVREAFFVFSLFFDCDQYAADIITITIDTLSTPIQWTYDP